ncbi:MAG: glycosyltransferase, partial [Chitinophagaceae bacterium]
LWNLYPDRMIESINWIKNQTIFEALNFYNNKKLAKSIDQAIKELNFSNIILFNDNDMFRCFHLPELLKPAVSIYYSRDFMLAVDYWRVHGEKMEPELIAKNNVCVANSTYLANYCRKYNPLSFYVGQGCELDMFMQVTNTSMPADMQALQSPIIGYVGALMHIRLDIQVLKHIAQQRPNWQIVLVGPEDEEFKASDIHQLPNIHFLGSKPVADLPQYINAFDVCINPQLVNQVTIGNYPRKIDEYLAVGKPVVATNTEAMSIFKDYTYLADSKEAYVSLIEQALAENNAEKAANRKTFAASHSWENSVQAIYNAIQSFENPSLKN